jgi:cell division protein FtsQ
LQSVAARPRGPADIQSRTAPALRREAPRAVATSFAWATWAIRAGLVIGLAAASAGILRFGLHPADILPTIDQLTVKAGLGVNQIAVTGFKNTLSDDIFGALQIDKAGSILAYDATAARKRLESLDWVQSAQVTRALPDGLTVTIRERVPFAVWQHHQLMFLIDADGRTLEPTSRADHKQLPLVVGTGADASAHEFLAELQRHPMILGRMEAAIRVADRRWDIELKDAPRLLLPEEGLRAALSKVEQLQAEERIFERRVAAIDLRVADRISVRVLPDSPKAPYRVPRTRSGGV